MKTHEFASTARWAILSLSLVFIASTAAAADATTDAQVAVKTAPAVMPKAKPSKAAKNPDRLELDKTVVTGNRELPKVLYIVPWKKSGLGDLPAQPFNTLLDEALTPVDRDVFRRELHYYDALEAGAGQEGGPAAANGVTPAPASGQGEK